jgi:cyclophilin family peptidyl-prolyl cis-trans isomerase
MRRVLFAALFLCSSLVVAQTAAPAAKAPAAKAPPATVRVKLTTTDGVILLELDRAKAPITVDNFVQYVKDKHYDGTIFHRVIPGFMAQGGGYTAQFAEKPTRKPIKLEVGKGLSNERGTIAMAREPSPDTATSQFFINLVENGVRKGPRNLDTLGGGYAVFGKVIEGMEVVDAIATIPTGPGGPFKQDVPFRNAAIIKAEVLPPAKAVDKPAPAKTP